MARWENVLAESSRLLLIDTDPAIRATRAALEESAASEIDDEGRDRRTAVHSRWHFPRALRWWTRRSETIQLAG